MWWSEYCRINANNIPSTWDALKRAMRQRYVPSYYARDKLNELQRLKQGSSSVEDCYQELQTGLVRCGLVETDDAMRARFLGGLNRDIEDILDYKEYNSITRLFHFACKAEREVRGRHNKGRGNFSAGRRSSWTPSPTVPSTIESTPPILNNGAHPSSSKSAPQSSEASKGTSLAPTTSSGCTRDMKCHICKGGGHLMKDCPNKRAFIVREDGEYSSASDLDEDTRAMLATNNAGDTKEHDTEEIHINAEMADQYPSLVTMRVLSAQVGHTEMPQHHNLFQTKFVVKGHSVRVIIDGGSCNNLASKRW